jgi:hypothetical protein
MNSFPPNVDLLIQRRSRKKNEKKKKKKSHVKKTSTTILKNCRGSQTTKSTDTQLLSFNFFYFSFWVLCIFLSSIQK